MAPGLIPPSLSCVKMYMDQAEILQEQEPSLAFFFKLYASEIGLERMRAAPDEQGQSWLLRLMNELDETKKQLQCDVDSTETRAHFEKEAWRLLKEAKEAKSESGGNITPEERVGIARKFRAASMYFEVLTLFGGTDDEVRRATLHCKVTLRDILRTARDELRVKAPVAGSVEAAGQSDGPAAGAPEDPPHDRMQARESGWPATGDGAQQKRVELDVLAERSLALKKAERDARHGLSAIQFGDVDTAINHFESAVQELQLARNHRV